VRKRPLLPIVVAICVVAGFVPDTLAQRRAPLASPSVEPAPETRVEAPQAATTPAADATTAADTTTTYPKKMPATEGWETVLALPGKLVYLPFWLTFKTAEGAIWFYERKLAVPDLMQYLVAADGSRGIYPLFEPRYGGGAVFYLKNWPGEGARFDMSFMVGLHGRQRHRIRHRRIPIFNNRAKLAYRLRYNNLPDERFFGIGPNSKKENETNYREQMVLGELTLGKRFHDRLQVDVIGAIEHNVIGDGVADLPSLPKVAPDLPGIGEELTMVRFGFGLDFDGRNREMRPSKGAEVMFRGGWIQDATDNDLGLSIVAANVVGYVEPYHNRVLVFRVAGEFTDPLPGRQTPFYWLPQLGRLETIRGLTRGRYRDNDMVLGSIEYRWAVSTFGDALLFVDGGQVAGNIFNDFTTSNIVWSFGGGYRIWWSDGGTALRAEVGVSKERVRFHFVITG